MVTLSACCCKGGIVSTKPGAAPPKMVAAKRSTSTVVVTSAPARAPVRTAAAAPAPAPAARQKRPCTPYVDTSACYTSEADRDMGRLRDDLPPGGDCGPMAAHDGGMGGDGHKCGGKCGGCPKCGH